MLRKVIGKVCKNPDCELKDKVREDYNAICECGQAMEEVSVTDTKKVALLGLIILLILGTGVYVAVMKLRSTAVNAGKELIESGVKTAAGSLAKEGLPQASPVPTSTQPSTSITVDHETARRLVSDGLADAKRNDMQAALEKFKSATEKDPSNAQAFGNLGAAYMAVGKTAEALDASSKAIKLQPTNPIWHLNTAELYSKENNKDEAFAELESAFQNGFKDFGKLKSFDFRNIKKDPKFDELIQKYRG